MLLEHESEANYTPEYINEIARIIRERDEEHRELQKVLLVVDSCIAMATLALIAMLLF